MIRPGGLTVVIAAGCRLPVVQALTVLTNLRKICNHPSLLGASPEREEAAEGAGGSAGEADAQQQEFDPDQSGGHRYCQVAAVTCRQFETEWAHEARGLQSPLLAPLPLPFADACCLTPTCLLARMPAVRNARPPAHLAAFGCRQDGSAGATAP